MKQLTGARAKYEHGVRGTLLRGLSSRFPDRDRARVQPRRSWIAVRMTNACASVWRTHGARADWLARIAPSEGSHRNSFRMRRLTRQFWLNASGLRPGSPFVRDMAASRRKRRVCVDAL